MSNNDRHKTTKHPVFTPLHTFVVREHKRTQQRIIYYKGRFFFPTSVNFNRSLCVYLSLGQLRSKMSEIKGDSKLLRRLWQPAPIELSVTLNYYYCTDTCHPYNQPCIITHIYMQTTRIQMAIIVRSGVTQKTALPV